MIVYEIPFIQYSIFISNNFPHPKILSNDDLATYECALMLLYKYGQFIKNYDTFKINMNKPFILTYYHIIIFNPCRILFEQIILKMLRACAC